MYNDGCSLKSACLDSDGFKLDRFTRSLPAVSVRAMIVLPFEKALVVAKHTSKFTM